jgi:FtsP/CotA-like multicopper oxidase with cupredoxin domain
MEKFLLNPGRRRFVHGLNCALATAAFPNGSTAGWGASSSSWGVPVASGAVPAGAVLAGTELNLEVGSLEVNYTGVRRFATAVNGQVPGPLLRWREGDTVTVRVANRLRVPTSIHWHGVIVPADMDGVPGLSFPGIAPGETFVYRFRLKQSGTYWYHSHSRFQEQVGLYGPIVIDPRDGARHSADREHVVLLSDWSDSDPERLYRTLKLHSGYYNFKQLTLGDFFHSVRKQGLKSTLDERLMWGAMRMNRTDLADVSGYTYTYLMNGATPAGNWTALFKPGERVRLRFINGSSMSFFDVRIPGLKLTVVAVDGPEIEPVSVDEFRMAAGEVYDVIVEPREDRAYTLFAQSIDRSGFARGTLAPRPGMQAEVPPMDPRPLLTMAEMGMGHGTAMGPMVDAENPDPRVGLDDPGVGLRDNGRRVLTYADLRALDGPVDSRPPTRDIVLHLTGHMERFVWSFDGRKFSESQPLKFNFGERLRLVLINHSMMNHPIHLHGMWGEVEGPNGEILFRKHTINVQPGQKLGYCVTADAPGHWAYHCHLLYHMEAGMFREVHVEQRS